MGGLFLFWYNVFKTFFKETISTNQNNQKIYNTYTKHIPTYTQEHICLYMFGIFMICLYIFLGICYAYFLEESGLNSTINRPKACSTNPSFSWTINKSKYTWLGLHIYIRACVSVYIWVLLTLPWAQPYKRAAQKQPSIYIYIKKHIQK